MDRITKRLESIISDYGYSIIGLMPSYNPSVRVYRVLKESTGLNHIAKYAFKDEGKEIIRAGKVLREIGRHPNIVSVSDIIDVGKGDSRVMIMEDVEGEDLEVFNEGDPIDGDLALDMVYDICFGLDAVHSKGLVHRDLAPGNIIYTHESIKLIDFGSAGISGQRTSSPYTLGYASPEQICGGDVDERSDIYAVGGILFRLTTGFAPFKKAFQASGSVNRLELIRQMQENPEKIFEQDTDKTIDDDLHYVISRCLKTNPEERPQNAYAVLDLIDYVDSGEESVPSLKPSEINIMPFLEAEPVEGEGGMEVLIKDGEVVSRRIIKGKKYKS